jgi:hypothetical protein
MRWQKSRWFCMVLILSLGMVACAATLAGNYGRISPSREVARAFEGYRVNHELRYYISGPDRNPNAFMGLERNYRLDPAALWREVPMTEARMKEIVEGMQAKASQLQMTLHGFELTDRTGRPIGVWYSILKGRTFLMINDDGTVRIDTPPLDLYEPEEGGSLRDHAPRFGAPGR